MLNRDTSRAYFLLLTIQSGNINKIEHVETANVSTFRPDQKHCAPVGSP